MFVIVSPSALLIAINAVMEIFSRIASHGPSREKRKGEKVCKIAEHPAAVESTPKFGYCSLATEQDVFNCFLFLCRLFILFVR